MLSKRDILEAIPLLILTAVSFYGIISLWIGGYKPSINLYAGSGLIITIGITFFINRRIYKYAMGIFLAFANFHLIIFSNFAVWVAFGSLKIHALPFAIMLTYIFIHRNELLNLLRLYTKKEN